MHECTMSDNVACSNVSVTISPTTHQLLPDSALLSAPAIHLRVAVNLAIFMRPVRYSDLGDA